ncbi:MAG: hypothetical protein K0V04_39340 [Deltaproteobacteria bacterium]|nr:hypothetical protein [Deltaproteobacteria bacterium]
MLGPLLRVARPDDWTGKLASIAIGLTFVSLVVLALLVRLPPRWVALVDGMEWIVRVAIVVVAWLLLWGARTVLDSRLPRAAVLFGSKVRFHDGTRRRAVAIDDVGAVHIEQRPPPVHEVFVLEQRDGSERDMCPVHWAGAPALHRTLERRLATAQRRRARVHAARQRRAGQLPNTSSST